MSYVTMRCDQTKGSSFIRFELRRRWWGAAILRWEIRRWSWYS